MTLARAEDVKPRTYQIKLPIAWKEEKQYFIDEIQELEDTIKDLETQVKKYVNELNYYTKYKSLYDSIIPRYKELEKTTHKQELIINLLNRELYCIDLNNNISLYHCINARNNNLCKSREDCKALIELF